VEIERFIDSVKVFDMHALRWLEMQHSDCEFGYRHSIFRQNPQRFMITQVRLRLAREMQVNDTYGALRAELDRRGIDAASAADVYDAVVHIRRQKLPDPSVEANVGSFFKNPVVSRQHYEQLRNQYPGLVAYPQGADVKLAAGWLIERAGFKGKSENGVCMHPRQALVLVNRSGASAGDVLAFADAVVAGVKSLFGVVLQREPLVVSSDGHCSAA
jgi:UDP-N-acetylmuramate dehydrogenase